jgi:L-iditol 2-dehydrogenase
MAVELDAIPEQMTALVLHAVGEWSVETVDTPELTEVENVLVRLRAAAICGSDPKMMTGKLDWPPHYPFIPGHEYAGEVVAVGEDVDRFQPGDRVFGETHSGCGFCRACRRGQYQLCDHFGDNETGHRQIGHTLNGAFADYTAVPADLLYHLDDAISFPEGALIDTNAIALNCSERGDIHAGDTVVVLGTGIIGLCCVQHATAMGASRVIATGNPVNNELAADLGADHTVAYDEAVVERVDDLTDGRGADVTLEAVGVEATMRQAIEVTRKGGTVSLDGMPAEPEHAIPTREIVRKQLDVRGCRAHANLAEASARLVRTGQVDLQPFISGEYPLSAFQEAYRTFTAEDGMIRVVLQPD